MCLVPALLKVLLWIYAKQKRYKMTISEANKISGQLHLLKRKKKNLENAKISYKYQVFISALLKKKTKTLHSQTLLTNTKTNVFNFLCFLGRADGHLLRSHKRSPVPEKSHHLVTGKKPLPAAWGRNHVV